MFTRSMPLRICRIVLPLMQSYSNAGDFTVVGKLRSAAYNNVIYYGAYLIIFVCLLFYAAIKRLSLNACVHFHSLYDRWGRGWEDGKNWWWNSIKGMCYKFLLNTFFQEFRQNRNNFVLRWGFQCPLPTLFRFCHNLLFCFSLFIVNYSKV